MQFTHAFFYAIRYLKTTLLLCCIFYSAAIYGQHPDSLFIENIFNRGWKKIYTNKDSAVYYFEKGKETSKEKNFLPGLVTYYNYCAALMIAGDSIGKAFDYYNKAIAFASANNLDIDLGLTHMKVGNLHQFTGDYAKAGENYLAAAALLKTNEGRKKIIGLYRNIISTLNNLQQQNQSLQNVLPALKNDNTSEKEIVSILSQKKTNEASLDFPDQTTLGEIIGGDIYVIFGGAKFRIADFYVLSNYSNYRSVQKIPDGMLSHIPDIPREGTILSESNDRGKVWLIKDKQRHLIENPKALQFFGGWDALCTVPAYTLRQVPDAGDMVTLQNVLTTFNFKKEYEVLIDTLKITLVQNTWLLAEVGKKLKAKNNELQKRIILLWTSLVGIIALLCIGIMLLRYSRQKQKLHRQSLQVLKAEQALQRKMELEQERNRIATDIHDDLGAGLSTIRFLSEKVRRNSFSDATKKDAEKIVNNSNELVQKMNELIWAMNEKNDTLEDLLFYTRSYAAEYGEENNLQMEIIMPDKIPACMVTGEIRRNVFLTLKESLHNVVKHAAAKKVTIHFKTDKNLFISIQDDGKGFETNKDEGNGLKNMKKRIESIGGFFEIINADGVIVKMNVPFNSV